MFSKSFYWMRRHLKSARFAAVLSFLALIIAFGVVQASGPMRPQPPMRPGGMGMWGHMRQVWYPMEPVPTIKIIAVVEDESVTFETADFPEDEDFAVTMGKMYTRGINGIEVGTFNSGEGGTFQQTFEIPEDLYGEYRISIRAQTDHTFPYYSYNWFYNNTTEEIAPSADTDEADAVDTEEAAETTEDEAAEAEETEEAAETTEGEAAEAEETEEAADATEGEAEETEEAAGELTGVVWQWVEVTDPVDGTQVIDSPENYQVEFLPEGGMNIQADCNMGTGSYTDEDGSLMVSLGAMTLAMCQEGSFGDDFVNYLSASAVYFFGEEGHLYIDMFADAGTLKFRPAGEETAEVGTGGAEETAETPEGEDATTDEAEETTDDAETMDEPASIADIAASDEQFSTLVTALTAAGLVDTLAGEGEFTVFAPTNDAFDALPEGTLDSLVEDPEGSLTNVLLYHVVSGVVPAATVVTLESAETLEGESVAISVVDGEVFLNETVKVIVTDVEASNGIIHVIDGVLIPASMSEEEAAEGEEAATDEAAEGEEAAADEAAEGEAEEAPEGAGLVGGIWQWAEFSDAVEGAVTIEDPSKYTAEFLTDGTVNVQADCNSGRGSYTVDGSNITIGDLAMTRALCEEGSMSDEFVMYLQSAAIYFFEDVNLYMDLPADGGTMMFSPVDGDETASFVRNSAMKVAAVNGAEETEEEPVPSFEICTVVKNESVVVITADFPEGEVFDVKMGPVLVAAPMKPHYGPMPMPMPMPNGNGTSVPPTTPIQAPRVQSNANQIPPDAIPMNMGIPPGGMNGGMGHQGNMWGKPMPPKVYVPFYYEAGTLESDGGSFEATFEIPAELAGYYRIQIMLRTDHQYPYYAYNWFYNNDASVCDDVNGD